MTDDCTGVGRGDRATREPCGGWGVIRVLKEFISLCAVTVCATRLIFVDPTIGNNVTSGVRIPVDAADATKRCESGGPTRIFSNLRFLPSCIKSLPSSLVLR